MSSETPTPTTPDPGYTMFGQQVDGANESPGLFDGVKKIASDMLGIGAGAAATAQRAAAIPGSDGAPIAPNAHQFSMGLNQVLNYFKKQVDESMSPGAKDALENSRNHIIGAAYLNAMGIVPQAGLMIGAGAVGGLPGVAAAGAAVQVGQDIDAAIGRFNSLSDEELQKQSPIYKGLREQRSENEARMDLTNQLYSWKQLGTSSAIGATQFLIAQRFLPGSGASVGRTVGAIATDTGVNAAGGGAGAASTNYAQQAAGVTAGTQNEINWGDLLGETGKGAILGGALGLAASGVHGAAHRLSRAGTPPKPGEDQTPQQAIPEDVTAALANKPEPEVPPAAAPAATPVPPQATTNTGTAAAPVTPPRNRRGRKAEEVQQPAVPDDQAAAIAARRTAPVPDQVAEATQRVTEQQRPPEPVDPLADPVPVPEPVQQASQRVREPVTAETLRPEDIADEPVPQPVVDAAQRVAQRPPETPPEVVPRGFDDTGRTVPETAETMGFQVQKVMDGQNAAALIPKGTPMPAELRAAAREQGLSFVSTPKGIYVIDPAKLSHSDVHRAIREGRDGELLGLGPVNKQEVAVRINQGERPVGVVERTPDGVEVKAAAGTEQTAPVQVRAMEGQRAPENVVRVEQPEQVIADRQGGGPRILEDVSQKAAEERQRTVAERKAALNDAAVEKSKQGTPEQVRSMADAAARRKFYRDANREIAKAAKEGREAADWARIAKNVESQQANGKRLSPETMSFLQQAHDAQVEAARVAKAQAADAPVVPKRSDGKVAKLAIKRAAKAEEAAKPVDRDAEIKRLALDQKSDEKTYTSTPRLNATDAEQRLTRSADGEVKVDKDAVYDEIVAGKRAPEAEAEEIIRDVAAEAERAAAARREAARREGAPEVTQASKPTAAPKVEVVKRKIGLKGQEVIQKARELAAKRAEAKPLRDTVAETKTEAKAIVEKARADRQARREREYEDRRKESVTRGTSVHPDMAKYGTEIKEMLGITERVVLVHPEDLRAVNRDERLGLSPLESASADRLRDEMQNNPKFAGLASLKAADGTYFVVVRRDVRRSKMLEVLTHEMGHVAEVTTLARMMKETPELRSEIKAAYEAWLQARLKGDMYGVVKNLRAWNMAKDNLRKSPVETLMMGTEDWARMNGQGGRSQDTKYWLGFNEWFADNVARWAQTDAKPMSVMERYFSRIADAYKRIWAKLTGKAHLPDATIAKFLNSIKKTDRTDLIEAVTRASDEARPAMDALPQVRRDLTQSASDFRREIGGKWRRFKDKVSTNMMLAERATEAFKGSEAPRLVAEAIEQRRVAADAHLNREGGGNEVTRVLSEMERKYLSDGQWEKAVDVAHDATVYNVNPHGDNAHLGKDKTAGWQSKARLADIEQRLAALPADLRNAMVKAEKFFRSEQDEMSLRQIETILDKAGIDEPGLAKRIHEKGLTDDERKQLDTRFKSDTLITALDNALDLKKIDGWYLPLRRRGDYVVTGTKEIKAPAGAMLATDKAGNPVIRFAQGGDAASRKAARNYVQSPDAELVSGVSKVWVDKADPSKRLDAEDPNAVPAYDISVQTQHTEFHPTESSAIRSRAELEAGGLKMQDVQKRQDMEGGDRRMLSSDMATIVRSLEQRDRFKNMNAAQKNEVIQALAQASLRLNGGRLASARLPRRRVAGYSKDLVRNTAEFAVSSANFIAGHKFDPVIDTHLKSMQKTIQDHKHGNDGQAVRRDEVYAQLESRAYGEQDIAPTKANDAIRRLLQLSHLDKLAGVSYHVINSAEPWTTALPVIGGRHGLASTAKALTAAYDLIGARSGLMAGLRDTKKAFRDNSGFTDYLTTFRDEIAKGTNPAEAKRLGDLLQHIHDRGLFDRDSGMEVGFQSRPDSNIVGRGLDRADLMSRQVGAAVEAINRAVTSVSAYRLEFAKNGGDHAAALKYAAEATHDTMGNYSSSNASPLFRHPLARVALQFKKFGQKTYYLMGKLMRKSLAGDTEAMKQFAGLMMTHGLVAGALGLPLEPVKLALIAANALGATTFSYDDFENMMRRGAAGVLGSTGGELVTRGLVRAAGIDVSNRMSLASLVTMGQPQSEKRKDIMAWLGETAMGAPVGTIIQQVEGVQALFRQDFVAAADKLIPLKAARDANRSIVGAMGGKTDRNGRQVMEPYTPYQAAIRALGFAPAAEAERQEHRRAFSEANRSDQRVRTELTTAYIKATPAERMRIWGQVERYNRELPVGAQDARITRQQLDRAVMTRQREVRDETVVNGMRTNRRNQHIYDRNDVYND